MRGGHYQLCAARRPGRSAVAPRAAPLRPSAAQSVSRSRAVEAGAAPCVIVFLFSVVVIVTNQCARTRGVYSGSEQVVGVVARGPWSRAGCGAELRAQAAPGSPGAVTADAISVGRRGDDCEQHTRA